MNLNDEIWKKIDGGYKTKYDVSIPLKKLEETSNIETINQIFTKLWDELHHQGDVGLASYLALPQLVRIGKLKGLFDWNLLGICCTIEIQRNNENNPHLPIEFQDLYEKGLLDLRQFVLDNFQNSNDSTTKIIALATLAVTSGQIKLGKAIMEMEDEDLLNEFLLQF